MFDRRKLLKSNKLTIAISTFAFSFDISLILPL